MSDADLLIALTHRDMLTVAEAALWFNVSRGWFFDRIERREIPYYGQRRAYRVSKSEVEDYMRRGRVPTEQEERSKIRKYIINNKL